MTARTVVVVGHLTHPGRGSELARGWGWATSLAERGHTVHLLARPFDDSRETVQAFLAANADLARNLTVHWVEAPHQSVAFDKLPGELGLLYSYHRWQRAALEHARSAGLAEADVAHHVSFGSLQGGSVLHELGIPLVFGPVGGGQFSPRSMRGYFGDHWRFEQARTLLWVKLAGRNPVAIKTVRHAAMVLAENSDTRALATAIKGGGEVRIALGNGLPKSFADLPANEVSRPLTNTLIWIGKLIPRKAPSIAVDAMRVVAARHPDVKLRIVGEGPLREDLEAQIREAGLEKNVELIGRVERHEMIGLLDGSDAMLFTSLRDTFGIQNLEAWSRAVPTIYLDHHGVRDRSPRDGSIAVPLDDPAAVPRLVGEATADLLADPERRNALAARAREHSLKFTWPSLAEQAEKWYDEVISRHSVPARKGMQR